MQGKNCCWSGLSSRSALAARGRALQCGSAATRSARDEGHAGVPIPSRRGYAPPDPPGIQGIREEEGG